jgi:peptide deformylase
MTNLPIAQRGAEILGQVAQPLDFPLTGEIQQAIDDLIETAERSNGVGIAAPQVSQSWRLFILASRPSPRYPQAPTMEPIAIINPQILARSEEEVLGWEGCLSVPGLRGTVARAIWVEVEYFDRAGKLQQARFTDFVARIFQHEYDHLEGVLFVDRVCSADLISEEAYQKIMFDPLPVITPQSK